MSQSTDSPVLATGAGANGQASLSERVKGLRLGGQLEGKKSGGGGSAWLPWTLCFLMGVTWASFAIRAYTTGGLKAVVGDSASSSGSSATSSEGGKTARPAAAPAKNVAPDELVLDRKGNIIAAHQIQVSPIEVSGRIVKLFVEEGKVFKKGELLAELDQTSYQADYEEAGGYLESAQARLKELKDSWPREVEQARAELEEAQSLLSQYENDYKRFEEIRKSNSGVGAKEFDLAKFSFFTQTARVKQMQVALDLTIGPREQRIRSAEGEVRQAQARFSRAKWRLDNCRIVAPVDGIILTKRAEIGNLVNALAMNATLNGGICDMADLTDLEVDLDVDERDISKVFVDQDCYVRVDAYPNRRYQGRVLRVLPVANSSKAMIPIRVQVRVPRSEEGQFLRPQMGANVVFYNRKAPPQTADAPEPLIEK